MINIAIEGPDGVGKSTLCKNLQKDLISKTGADVIVIGQPNDIIKGLRSVAKTPKMLTADLSNAYNIKNPEFVDYNNGYPAPDSITLMMMASMSETSHFTSKLEEKALKRGSRLIVIHDRTVLSTLVYQGALRDPGFCDSILDVYKICVGTRFDLSFVLSGNPTDVYKRSIKDCSYDDHSHTICSIYKNCRALFGGVPSFGIDPLVIKNQKYFHEVFGSIIDIDTAMLPEAATSTFALTKSINECSQL